MTRPLRIIYSAGPGDVIRTFRQWVNGEDDSTQLSMTYSGMFYDVCRQLGAEAYIISCCERRDSVRDGKFKLVHRRTPFERGPGPLFYVGQEWAALRFMLSAIWFRADVAVVACGTVSWVSLQLLPLLGVAVVPTLHCVLWPPFRPSTGLQRFLKRIRSPFFKRSAFRILSASEEISDQVRQTTGGENRPLLQFLPTYRRSRFANIAPPPAGREARFNVLFAGRIEKNKGVFDLLSLAARFRADGESAVHFDLCGEGSERENLIQQAVGEGLSDRFVCHGHCDRETMRKRFEAAHVVIVPTTGDFVEGFNQVVAEAVLANRPVITSDVCPALTYVKPAIVQVPVDDVKAYGDAILALKRDEKLYDQKYAACAEVAEQFYDADRGWAAAVTLALRPIQNRLAGTDEALSQIPELT